MPDEARLVADGVEWQRFRGRLKPKKTGVDTDNLVHGQPKQARPRRRSHKKIRVVALLLVSRQPASHVRVCPAKCVSPRFYQVRPMDETKTHYGALPAGRLLFPSRPSCFRERTVPKRPACNPAYQRHGGCTQGRCSFDTRVPRAPSEILQTKPRAILAGFASSAAHCVPESRPPGWWPYCIGTQSTPSGCAVM